MRFILFIIFSLCLPLVMQGQGQNVWTQNDSLKLKKILAGQAEIRINREALRELDRVFLLHDAYLNLNLILPFY